MRRASERTVASRATHGFDKTRLLNVGLDLLLVALALFLIVYAVARWGNPSGRGPSENAERLTLGLEITDANERMVNAVRSHGMIFFLNEETALGHIEEIEILQDTNGNATLLLTVSVTATHLPEEGYYIGEHRIALGAVYDLSVGNYFGRGCCVELQR